MLIIRVIDKKDLSKDKTTPSAPHQTHWQYVSIKNYVFLYVIYSQIHSTYNIIRFANKLWQFII